MTRRLGSREPCFDIASAVDDLRQLVLRADAMVCATEHQLERFTRGEEDECEDTDDGDNGLEHLAHLLGAAKESVQAAVYASGQIAAALAKREVGS
ncbi:MAG: hypothetical protein E6J90_33090 [Deltaproteobacteria bacterium]|nr:MAG: hypothetical protein E6J90_33090 [Deltaproteobacteria bacterium]TMQ18026.1 MAG: hypothetical protein E6J91_08890 [Deltaproteobacteria bacterium]